MGALLVCAGLLQTARASADGDPASDVLASQPLFLPQDAGLAPTQQAELAGLLAAAHRMGFALRAAVIASPTDLGSVTGLWRQPDNYARFLDQELSLVFPGPLLVAMPDGYGLAGPGAAHPVLRAALAGLSAAAPGPEFGRQVIAAVQRLAAAAGHPLPQISVRARPSGGSIDPGALVALILGAVLILAAWAASLRARPLRMARSG